MSDTSIVVKTCRKDLRNYVQLQKDLVEFGHLAVRVCVPGSDFAAFAPVLASGFELVTSEQLLRRFAFPWPIHDNWYSQQLIKLLLVATSRTEACWVLDSNTLLMQPLPDPWEGERVVLALGSLQPEDRLWFHSSAQFLSLPPNGPPLDPVNQPLRRSVVQALLMRIMRLYRRPPLHPLVAAMVAGVRRGRPFWTEYGLYRSFASQVARSAHVFRDGVREVAYFHQDRQGLRLAEWLDGLRRSKPQMVKLYARRPNYRMDAGEFRRLCRLVRECR